MKHLEIYESLADVQYDLSNNILIKPYIALYDNRHKIEFDNDNDVIIIDNTNYNDMPLTFKILESGSIIWKCSNSSISKTIQYKLNDGDWTSITSTTSGANINVVTDDIIQFKGNNNTYANNNYYNYFSATCNFTVYGNIMSLLFNDSFNDKISISGKNYAFFSLFKGNTYIKNIKNLILPATTLSDCCYKNMFLQCTGIQGDAPILPAISLTSECYRSMFNECTGITKASPLPATNLAYMCYYFMYQKTAISQAPTLSSMNLAEYCYACLFNGCSNLTIAPSLPATSLKRFCYTAMFEDCINLIQAPELIATTLSHKCYENMFINCSKLNYIYCAAADVSSDTYTSNWVNGVSPTGTFKKSSSANWSTGTSGIPSGWTIENI